MAKHTTNKKGNSETKVNSMSITRALATIKTLTKTISKRESEECFASLVKGEDAIYPVKGSSDEIVTSLASKHQSFMDKYDELVRLKFLVAKANVTTKVNYNGKEYTLYELITKKDTMEFLVGHYKDMLSAIDKVNHHRSSIISSETREVLDRRNELIKANRSVKEIDRIYPEVKDSDYKVVAPLTREEVTAKIEELENELAEFDMLLSEFNAKTTIG